MDLQCANAEADSTHSDNLVACDLCHSAFCAPCREAITGNKSHCPQCGNLLPIGAKGACGDGSCDV